MPAFEKKIIKKGLFSSLVSKILISIVSLIFIFGSIATFGVYLQTKSSLEDSKKKELLYITQGQTGKLWLYLNQVKKETERIKDFEQIKDFLQNKQSYSVEEINGILGKNIISNEYLAIYLMDPLGNVLASTDERFLNQNYSFRDYFKQALTGKFGAESAVGATSKELGIYLSQAVLGSSNEVIGVVVIKVSPDAIYSQLRLPDEENLNYLFTGICGVVLFSNNQDFVYKSLGQLSVQEKAKCALENRFPGIDIEPLDCGEVKNQIDQGNNSGAIILYDDLDHEKEVVAYSRTVDYPFILVVEVEEEVFAGSAVRNSFLVAALVISAAFLASLIIAFITSRFLRPITDLETIANRIAEGDFSRSFDIRTGDEIERLANSIKKMVDRLKNSKQIAEEEVKKRTLQLERINKALVGRELKMIELKKLIKKLEENSKK